MASFSYLNSKRFKDLYLVCFCRDNPLLRKLFTRNLALVNLTLTVFGIISFVATINALVFWTNWGGQFGEIGGVLDYTPFGQSVVYHVTKENLRGEQLFVFPDTTAYLLLTLIVFNGAFLFLRHSDETESSGFSIRGFAILSLTIAAICTVLYVWGTMMFIDESLKRDPQSIGGALYYGFPLFIAITHVYQGHTESSLNWRTPDFTLWLLTALLLLTLAILAVQLNTEANDKNPPHPTKPIPSERPA